LKSGEDQHRVGMRVGKWRDLDHLPFQSSLFLSIYDQLQFALGGLSSLSQTDLQW
jgi:hypothetical protein